MKLSSPQVSLNFSMPTLSLVSKTSSIIPTANTFRTVELMPTRHSLLSTSTELSSAMDSSNSKSAKPRSSATSTGRLKSRGWIRGTRSTSFLPRMSPLYRTRCTSPRKPTLLPREYSALQSFLTGSSTALLSTTRSTLMPMSRISSPSPLMV